MKTLIAFYKGKAKTYNDLGAIAPLVTSLAAEARNAYKPIYQNYES